MIELQKQKLKTEPKTNIWNHPNHIHFVLKLQKHIKLYK